MTQRPKTPFEVANELLREVNPRELLSKLGREKPGLDDNITNEHDVLHPRDKGNQ